MTATGTARVAVVGGGYAGMAAAVSLRERGISSVVFETSKVLGGRARRIDYRDEVLDNGQHILSGAYSELLRMINLVGVHNPALQRTPLALNMPPHFSLRAPRLFAPFHLAWALLTATGLTFAERVAAVRFIQALKRRGFKVDAPQTVTALLARHRQPERLIRYLWQPLTVSALNTPISTASAQVFANVLRDALGSTREASDLMLPHTNLSALFPEAAAKWLARDGGVVEVGVRVRGVAETVRGFRLDTEVGAREFNAVILAIGPHQFDSIDLPDRVTEPVFAYEPIVTVYFKFDQPIRLPSPMQGQAEGMVQWFFDRRLLSGQPQLPDGLIAAVISASGPHMLLAQDELASRALAELTGLVGQLPVPIWSKVITEKFATFACTDDAHGHRPNTETRVPGLFLAGDYVACDYPATLEAAVRNGQRAAQFAANHISRLSVS